MATITVNQTTQVEIEVQFPLYVKSGYSAIRFDSEDGKGIYVSDYGKDFPSGIQFGTWPTSWFNYEPATKEEFEAFLNQVQSKINSLI